MSKYFVVGVPGDIRPLENWDYDTLNSLYHMISHELKNKDPEFTQYLQSFNEGREL